MTDYEKIVEYLRTEAIRIRGEWDGDEANEKEHRAWLASDLLDQLRYLDERVKELDL